MKTTFYSIYRIIGIVCLIALLGSCSYESDTVNPQDIEGSTGSVPPGDISLSVTSVSTVDDVNQYVTIVCNNALDTASVVKTTSFRVFLNGPELTAGQYTLTYSTPPNYVTITFVPALTAGNTIDITLTNGILALADGSALTNPGTWNLTVADHP
jgi:hypothetical protein